MTYSHLLSKSTIPISYTKTKRKLRHSILDLLQSEGNEKEADLLPGVTPPTTILTAFPR